MVPCAQGRVIVETARPAPPFFATCTRYRRAVTSTPSDIAASVAGTTSSSVTQLDQQSTSSSGKGAIGKNMAIPPYISAARPEDLGVTPWYLEDYPTIDSSPGPTGDRSSYPSYLYTDAEVNSKPDMISTRNSSLDSELPRPPSSITAIPRKAYMDLREAIALLDETCPNQEVSPSLTPRTPLTPHPRNKRARSKSSDNSSNYSNDRLSDRSFENARTQDKDKKRPFLKKIGISKTEDKPFLAKIAPRIIGKPYLEKIGPSRAVERPFLEKIGSSKTLDKFIFDIPRYKQKNAVKNEPCKDEPTNKIPEAKKPEERRALTTVESFAAERRRSGKGHLLKMYSFETEDLESSVQTKDNRDPLRGASLDDVLDSGPSSLPLETIADETSKPETKERFANGAELLKCRVTTSEEIIFSNASSFGSDKEPNSWSNSPKKKWYLTKGATTPTTPTRRKVIQTSEDKKPSVDSIANSPTKRPISTVLPDRSDDSQLDSPEKNVYSPTKTRRQTYDDILERNGKDADIADKSTKQAQFERRGISSDNLLSKDRSLACFGYHDKDRIDGTREASSVDSLAHRGAQGYTKETFKQLQDIFKHHEVPVETYADFKKRTRGCVQSAIARQQELSRVSARNEHSDDRKTNETTRAISATVETESLVDKKSEPVRGGTVRSVLKKQQGVDHHSDQELDSNASIRRLKRRIFHEPSQETMDLLTELRKVKSQLRTPSWEKDLELEAKPARHPKRILLTDKEFCLSVERENSIRRPSRVLDSLEKTEEGCLDGKQENEKKTKANGSDKKVPGPALFEKKCLSLDFVDEEKPHRPEARAISLASARNLEKAGEMIDYADFALICDSKSYSSDVFNTPSKETNVIGNDDPEKDIPKQMNQNHCTEVDITIPIDQKVTCSKGNVHVQSRTSDVYEIISPRTPFRVKKRLGKISIEDIVKPESFTLGSKVDCRSAVTQKRTKCFPL
ncbi:uncharacterized protein LOC128874060 [Hylaeus volcanicus]|uniref:uncharacterized protein LOC128874060 n=1 Tax=Hylaeus volcanicus TaxID=313075 RepID=UPI0023B7825E|nr:uncharacterized protein LOC128874060 [Hylaeus volcanicus]